MSDAVVPFNRPTFLGGELDNIAAAISTGKISGDGQFTLLCNGWLEQRLSAPKALLTHSCTAALEMAAILCELQPGDEVIMPSFTFVSTANAVVLRGAVPIFVDIDPFSLNIDPEAIVAALTERTKAIFVVHYAGVPCDMDVINAIAQARGITVVEDAAQALGSTYKGRPAGMLADMAAFSFHETKNLNSGEGGALVLSREDLGERAEIIREKGTNRSRFFRGQIDKYTWVDIGSSYLPSDILAAYLLPQLEAVDLVNADRLATWNHYHEALAGLELDGYFKRPQVPDYAQHNGHLYYLILGDGTDRDDFLAAMRRNDIGAVFHYIPLHSSPAGLKYGRTAGSLAITDHVSEKLVRLPLYFGIGADRDRVVQTIRNYFKA